MPTHETLMRQEIAEIPVAVERLLTEGGGAVAKAVEAARARSALSAVGSARVIRPCLRLHEIRQRADPAAADGFGRAVGQGFPVIAFAAADAAENSVVETADALAAKGALVFAVSNRVKRATALPHARTGHWLTDPIAAIVSFYGMVETVALRRGLNPDAPRHLNKVTETL